MSEEERPPLELVSDEPEAPTTPPTLILTYLEEEDDISIKMVGDMKAILATGMLSTALGWFAAAPVRHSMQLLTQSVVYSAMGADTGEVN